MRADAVTVQADGRIVVGGWTEYGDFLVVRILATGTLDLSFGGGYVATDFDGQNDVCHGVLVLPDGRIVAAGTARVGGDNDFAVARYLPGGALDTSFGGDGKVTIGFGGNDQCWDLALQDDGMLVLVGEYYDDWDIDTDFAVARLTSSGSLDGGFNGDGKESYGFDGTDKARAVAIAPDGKIVLAGKVFNGARDVFGVCRFTSEGYAMTTSTSTRSSSTSSSSTRRTGCRPLSCRMTARSFSAARSTATSPSRATTNPAPSTSVSAPRARASRCTTWAATTSSAPSCEPPTAGTSPPEVASRRATATSR
jgi:uncharacterized delta-60 repeat protein